MKNSIHLRNTELFYSETYKNVSETGRHEKVCLYFRLNTEIR